MHGRLEFLLQENFVSFFIFYLFYLFKCEYTYLLQSDTISQISNVFFE